jgi:hypothetical protein
MAGPVLYSTNPWFTEFVCDEYHGGRYGLLWCSEFFDPASHGRHSIASRVAPSSSPRTLYYDVLNAVQTSDNGNRKLEDYRKTFTRLASDWLSKGALPQFHHDEIIALVGRYPFTIWEPRRVVIPREPLEASGRLQPVPADKRAGVGMEYQAFDLLRAEFDIIILEP